MRRKILREKLGRPLRKLKKKKLKRRNNKALIVLINKKKKRGEDKRGVTKA